MVVGRGEAILVVFAAGDALAGLFLLVTLLGAGDATTESSLMVALLGALLGTGARGALLGGPILLAGLILRAEGEALLGGSKLLAALTQAGPDPLVLRQLRN
jgi:hypothetical protein